MRTNSPSNPLSTILMILLILWSINCSAQDSVAMEISRIDSCLQYLIEMQQNIRDLHPCLNTMYPVVFPDDIILLIFDYDSASNQYHFIKKEKTPFPLPADIQASFPLSVYENKPCCIVSKNIFDSKNGYVIIFHEFVHCWQASTYEQTIKQDLTIFQDAISRKDYSWEITHPFPYGDSLFVEEYSRFLSAIDSKNREMVSEHRENLKMHLSQFDWEYMLWQQWKEGFARFIENRIQSRLGMDENHYGESKPYNRILFYFGGAKYIDYLFEIKPDLINEPMKLFYQM